MSKEMTRRDQPISVDREVHHDFKAYCAFKRGYMIDLANKALVREMILNGYKVKVDPNSYGIISGQDEFMSSCKSQGGDPNEK